MTISNVPKMVSGSQVENINLSNSKVSLELKDQLKIIGWVVIAVFVAVVFYFTFIEKRITVLEIKVQNYIEKLDGTVTRIDKTLDDLNKRAKAANMENNKKENNK